jgi:hypothetical protein
MTKGDNDMYISLKDIQKLFEGTPSKLSDSKDSYCLSSFCLLSDNSIPDSFSMHCLYVLDDLNLVASLHPDADASFLVLTDSVSESAPIIESENVALASLILEQTDTKEVCAILQQYFDDVCGMGLFADSLLEILFFEGGIQAMLDQIYAAFQNPLFVFDPDFKLIAATTGERVVLDEQAKKILENGGFTEEEFKIVNQSRIHRKILESERPILTMHPTGGYLQLICAIDTQKEMGHIVLNALNRPFNDTDPQMLYLLKKAIDQQMKKDEFIRNNRGFNYEYFLRDLLEGKMAVGKAYQDRMNYTNTDFTGNLYCMVIETARSSETLNTMHFRSMFETQFPGTMSLMYQGGIIILFHPTGNGTLSEEDLISIHDLCRDYGLYAGMGNCFQDILKIKDYYKQALRAIELGICHQNNPGLFLYRDYYMNHVANLFTQKESLETFCHPQLKILLDYDAANQTDYAKILYTWLISERNMATTAKELFLHRNTLIYRMKKINSMIDVNFDDYYERQRIILSYEFYRAL